MSFCLTHFQQLNYPTRIVHPEHSEGSLGRSSNFQQLTNCLKFDTLSEPLYFQSLPTVKFCNPFVLITIRIARGGSTPLPARHLKFYFNSQPGRGVRNFLELSETMNCKLWTLDCFALAATISGVQPSGAVALAAGFLVAGTGGEAGGAFFPVDFGHAANDARAALPGGDLRALTANHFRGVRHGSTAGAYGGRLWF